MPSTTRLAAAGLALAAFLGSCTPTTTDPSVFPSMDLTTVAPSASPMPASSTEASSPGIPASPVGPVATAPVSATWARVEIDGDRPAPREDHTWTVGEDGRMAWLFGGRDGATVFEDLWSFDLVTERWQREDVAGPTPPGRFGHEAVLLPGDGILVWAGQAGSEFFDDIWLLDPENRSWSRLAVIGDIPDARYGSCSGVGPDGRLWISHGFTENGVRFDDTRAFSLEASRWTDLAPTGDVPIERCLHACWWTPDGRLALYGGQTNGVPALGDLWYLTPGPVDGEGGSWVKAPDQQAPARQLAAVARMGLLTVTVGGRDRDGEALGDTWVVTSTPEVLSPVRVSARPPARSGAALVHDARGDRLLLVGGIGDVAFGDLWELSFP
jgi:hypothetical protein